MGQTPVFIILCVAFTLWLLLLLVIVSRLNALGTRVNRLMAILNEFNNLEKQTHNEEERLRNEIRKTGVE